MTQKIKTSLTTPTGTGLSPCIQGIYIYQKWVKQLGRLDPLPTVDGGKDWIQNLTYAVQDNLLHIGEPFPFIEEAKLILHNSSWL